MKRQSVFFAGVLCGLMLLALSVSSCATVPPGSRERGATEEAETGTPAESVGDIEDIMDDGISAEAAEEGPDTEGGITAGILLGFDDNYYAGWEAAFPLFDRYGAKVTFFVQGNPAFCRNALEKGHDIGYHTENHV
ncbi:MAG: polysaccharide deacetylase family protein, partial [Spirochaetaceae bacterium]|nr:polysaccharide deacetylase family protein [Spirochaetaceae bacterium]